MLRGPRSVRGAGGPIISPLPPHAAALYGPTGSNRGAAPPPSLLSHRNASRANVKKRLFTGKGENTDHKGFFCAVICF